MHRRSSRRGQRAAREAQDDGALEVPVCQRDEGRTTTIHGDTRHVPYAWLKKRKSPEVRRYVAAETKYAKAHIPSERVEELYREQRARAREDDGSVPFAYRGYFHFVRDVAGQPHEVHCRRRVADDPTLEERCIAAVAADPHAVIPPPPPDGADTASEVLLDLNALKRRHRAPTVDVADLDCSPDNRLLAYAVNLTDEDEQYEIFVEDTETGALLRQISRIGPLPRGSRPGPHVAWASNSVLYFSVEDKKGREYAVARCDLNHAAGVRPTPAPLEEGDNDAGSASSGSSIGEEEEEEDGSSVDSTSDAGTKSHSAVESDEDGAENEAVRIVACADDHTGLSVVFREKDPQFTIDCLGRTHDDRFLCFSTSSAETHEWHLAPIHDIDTAPPSLSMSAAATPPPEKGPWFTYWPRQPGVQYAVFPHPSGFWLAFHDAHGAVNRRIDVHVVDPVTLELLRIVPLVRYEESVPVEDLDVYHDFVAISVLQRGFPRVLLLPFDELQRRVLGASEEVGIDAPAVFNYNELTSVEEVVKRDFPEDFPEDDLHQVEILGQSDGFSARNVRVRVDSMCRSARSFDLVLILPETDSKAPPTWKATLVRRRETTFHNPLHYTSRLVYASFPDGTSASGSPTTDHATTAAEGQGVPITVTYRRDLFNRGHNPLLLEAYGSYGDTEVPTFHPDFLSLLDRGVVMAFAMVRGGGQLGRAWHHAGRLGHRGNSIADFVAAGEHLVEQAWCDPSRLAATGGSAGATVVAGAVLQKPSLFHAVVLSVPFVDCLSTMLDATLPLTVEEYEEWGNPTASVEDYRAIKAYSPMDNVPTSPDADVVFPHILIDSVWHDSRVQVHEPAAFGAALRHCWGRSAKAGRVLLHYCNFKSDHGGETSRYDAAKNSARIDTYVLGALGVLGLPVALPREGSAGPTPEAPA